MIFCEDTRFRLSSDIDENRFWRAEPGFACCPSHTNFSRAKSRAERAKRTVRVAMRVATNQYAPRSDISLLDQHLMTNALMIELCDALFFHKIHNSFLSFSRQQIWCGIRMVKMNHDLVLIQNRFANLAKRFDGKRRGVIVAHDIVHIQQHDLARLHWFACFM